MELSIQERLKDLRVERGLTLEQLEEQVNLSKSALGSYEAKDFKDISHYAIIKLAKFYGVTADYLLGLSQTRNHPNADLNEIVCCKLACISAFSSKSFSSKSQFRLGEESFK